MDNLKQAILDALRAFARQRPGMEPGNYGSWKDYRAELRTATRDLAHAQTLLCAVELSGIDAQAIIDAAHGGRLDITLTADGSAVKRIDYCTGQYFPTEYRKAVCRVLASALWDNRRKNAAVLLGSLANETINGQTPGDRIRAHLRREFGRAIASRYFN